MQLAENFQSTVNVTRILLLGDFNLDQLQENVNKIHPLTFSFVSTLTVFNSCLN